MEPFHCTKVICSRKTLFRFLVLHTKKKKGFFWELFFAEPKMVLLLYGIAAKKKLLEPLFLKGQFNQKWKLCH